MPVARLIRYRHRLLMQFAPKTSPPPAPSLKRSFAQQAAARAHIHQPDDSSGKTKHPKLEETLLSLGEGDSLSPHAFPEFVIPSAPGRQLSRTSQSSSIRSLRSASLSNSSLRSSFKGQRKQAKTATTRVLDMPPRDQTFISRQHETNSKHLPPIKPVYEENPKSPLNNFCLSVLGRIPEYHSVQGFYSSGPRVTVWRTTVAIDTEHCSIVGIGDNVLKKDSERLAALSAVYQLHESGLLDSKHKVPNTSPAFSKAPTEVQLSDGSVVSYERARQFMDYYCRRFNFGYPVISLEEVRGVRGQNSTWEAVMTVGESRIGLGSGATKKAAQITCYLDVTAYLESCDAQLWKTFVEAAKSGKDLGLAPKVFFQMSDRLEDEVRDLCHDMRKSFLYKNSKTRSEVPSPSPSPRLRADVRRVSAGFLADKSSRLLKRRQDCLTDPSLERIRRTTAKLPVYTRAQELLDHIRDHDVTICMATTGSGKTTQIPQLILDDSIKRNRGAYCNIVCTQPRRIAAISVADRVAKERGECVGKSVGYQVRFDSKLPEEHGSITLCTTGVFLKRMQSALSHGGHDSRSLDNVTHVVVDEVHERDIDTDLLLVVLKRWMTIRKMKKQPLKIILMSATIDPTLFQAYFPDDQGQPASLTEIPGRSFPVTKYFLEDFVTELRPSGQFDWVFAQKSVVDYLAKEIGRGEVTVSRQSGVNPPVGPGLEMDRVRDEDLELPYPLIALTISHVLRRTDSGHVLVFLPGWDEIKSVQQLLLDPPGSLGLEFWDTNRYNIHVLHSSVPLAEQQVVFDPPPDGVRRIILATNIAETSITIPDVVYVVDTGKIKEQRYDPERHMSSLVSAWVGSSNLNQRAGRAGRHRAGEYFGILGRKRANGLHPHQTVEMKRVDLSNVVMHVKALNFPGVTVEDVLAATIEPPSAGRVEAAIKDLRMAGAMDSENNLTSLGRVLLQLPVEAQMGRLVLFGSFFRCLDPALTLAAILTNRDPFVSPMHLKEMAAERKNSWTPQEFRSDALAALQAYKVWWAMQSRGEYISANRFCVDNFLSKPTLLMIQKIKTHLLQSLYHAGVIDISAGGWASSDRSSTSYLKGTEVPTELNINGDSFPLLAALIAIASQPNFSIRIKDQTYRTAQDKYTSIHPSSVNHRKRVSMVQESGEKQLYAFAEKRQNISAPGAASQKYLMTTTRLDPMTYMLFGAYNLQVTERGLECDEWLPIVGNVDGLDQIQRLKVLMDSCMLRVFEGITVGRQRRREVESEEEDEKRDYSLSATEVKELDIFTRDIVRILNRYSEERIGSQSRSSTPMGSPSMGSVRLPSGYSTPYGGSRSSTPSRLSRRMF